MPKSCVHTPLLSKSTTFLVFTHLPLPRVCLVLLYILVSVQLLWHERHMGLWAFILCIPSSLWTGHCWVWALSLLPGLCPLLFYVRGLAGTLAMPLHCSCYNTTYHFTSLLPLSLRAEALASPFLTFFLLLGFTGQHSCWASPLHPLGFLAHFLLPYLFHFHGFLLNSLGFLGPITTPLPFITFQAYMPLCQPYEFTNSFIGIP